MLSACDYRVEVALCSALRRFEQDGRERPYVFAPRLSLALRGSSRYPPAMAKTRRLHRRHFLGATASSFVLARFGPGCAPSEDLPVVDDAGPEDTWAPPAAPLATFLFARYFLK